MKVVVANLGYKNVHWPICLREDVITLQVSVDAFNFWKNGNKNGWIEWAIENEATMHGRSPTRAVCSRWYNLMSFFSESVDDLWLHRSDDDLYWTTSRASEINITPIDDPFGSNRPYLLFRRSADKWRNHDKKGRRLQWKALHLKARDFLHTEATYQEVASDRGYRDYAIALIEGQSLERWHSATSWIAKQGDNQAVKIFSSLERTIWVAVRQIVETVGRSDGRQVVRNSKIKELRGSEEEIRKFLEEIYHEQEGLCALTGLPMLMHGDEGSDDFRLSVDRIDSNGHYEPTNLQLACRFANFWKSDRDDRRFKELVAIVQRGGDESRREVFAQSS